MLRSVPTQALQSVGGVARVTGGSDVGGIVEQAVRAAQVSEPTIRETDCFTGFPQERPQDGLVCCMSPLSSRCHSPKSIPATTQLLERAGARLGRNLDLDGGHVLAVLPRSEVQRRVDLRPNVLLNGGPGRAVDTTMRLRPVRST